MERAKTLIVAGVGAVAALAIYGAAATKKAAVSDGPSKSTSAPLKRDGRSNTKYRASFFRKHKPEREKIAALAPAKTVTEIPAAKDPMIAAAAERRKPPRKSGRRKKGR